jgi:hypothetical protein
MQFHTNGKDGIYKVLFCTWGTPIPFFQVRVCFTFKDPQKRGFCNLLPSPLSALRSILEVEADNCILSKFRC